jgi:hypothetical protein
MDRGTGARERRLGCSDVRGVWSEGSCGVTKLGADGPARRSRLVSLAWWMGPPPIPLPRIAEGYDRMTRSSR